MTDLKEERRREILMAALKAFSEKGYHATSVNDLVTASGLSKGTLYWYFKNKQAIFLAMIDMIFQDIGVYFEQSLANAQDLPPPERLRHVLTGMNEIGEEMLSFAGLYADFFTRAWQDPEVQENLANHYQHFIEIVAPVIQAGIDEGYFRQVDVMATTRTILGAIDGFWFQQILHVGDAQALLELHTDLVVRGLTKNDTGEGD